MYALKWENDEYLVANLKKGRNCSRSVIQI